MLGGRLARWDAGQHQSLVKEYLEVALRRSPNRELPDNGPLPEGTRRAALRAVQDGAIGKAAKLLPQVQHSLPVDIHGALAALHPQAPPPRPPADQDALGDDFTV